MILSCALKVSVRLCLALIFSCLFLNPLEASEAHMTLNGARLSLWWGLPFVGILLSLALLPIAAPRLWHHHYGKIAALWGGCTVASIFMTHELEILWLSVSNTIVHHYIPFVIMIAALYIITLGIKITCHAPATPKNNVLFICVGTVFASVIGTTGASILLIHPLLHMNRDRVQKKHLIIFFIFLVSNIGGALTPLGDPPLFLGFLEGVPFFWPMTNLFVPQLIMSIPLLGILYALDMYYWRREKIAGTMPAMKVEKTRIQVKGAAHMVLLALVVGSVLLSGFWKDSPIFVVQGLVIKGADMMRDGLLILIIGGALYLKKRRTEFERNFTWGPLVEVIKLFAAIFITAIPVISILQAGEAGALKALTMSLFEGDQPLNARFFWLTGVLSGFLDNAPTYLIFFHLGGGDPLLLTTTLNS
ncbi:MAG: sodium:proton antiporter, partial [Alphaproteobacteria bacterium]|nr:sodium:proton antiporter [Alphaproteobacteria bacterium]